MNMNRIALSVATALLLLAASNPGFEAQAQTAPKFEVVSIKARPAGRGIQQLFKPWMPTFQCPPNYDCGLTGNRFREISVSLADLIMDAYRVKKYQIIGLPSWGASGRDLYDLEAKVADDATPTVDEARLMLQSVLAERFQLRIHHETRELPVYALVAGKNGVKVLPNQSPCRNGRATAQSSNSASEYQFPWAFFAGVLSSNTDRPVVDETGLDGVGYCTADGQSPTLAIVLEMDRGSSVFTAVADKWGMRLEPKKSQVDVLVIESVTRPSEN